MQAQQLHNQLLEQNVKGELLKKQLSDLQQQNINAAVAQSPVSPPAAFAAPKAPPPPTVAKTTGRPVVSVAATSNRNFPPPSAKTTTVNGMPAPPPPANTKIYGSGRAVTFVGVNGDAASPPPTPAVPDTTVVVINGGVSGAAGGDAAVIVRAAKVPVHVDAKASDHATLRRPPNKIGQIRWPPPAPTDDDEGSAAAARPQPEIGRIQIQELKNEVSNDCS